MPPQAVTVLPPTAAMPNLPVPQCVATRWENVSDNKRGGRRTQLPSVCREGIMHTTCITHLGPRLCVEQPLLPPFPLPFPITSTALCHTTFYRTGRNIYLQDLIAPSLVLPAMPGHSTQGWDSACLPITCVELVVLPSQDPGQEACLPLPHAMPCMPVVVTLPCQRPACTCPMPCLPCLPPYTAPQSLLAALPVSPLPTHLCVGFSLPHYA